MEIRFMAVIVDKGKIIRTLYDDNDLNIATLRDINDYQFCQCGALIQVEENIPYDVDNCGCEHICEVTTV
jgi:hypothetical protein